MPNRPFFRYDLVAYHLADSEDRSLKDANTSRTPLSNCFIDRKLNASLTRTLTFVHEAAHFCPNVYFVSHLPFVFTINVNLSVAK